MKRGKEEREGEKRGNGRRNEEKLGNRRKLMEKEMDRDRGKGGKEYKGTQGNTNSNRS